MDAEPPHRSGRPDSDAYTQPLRVVRPVPESVPPAERPAPAARPVYAPAFGNLGTYAVSRFVALAVDFIAAPFLFACFAFDLAERGTLAFAPKSSAGFGSIAALALGAALALAIVFEAIFETTLGKALFGLGVRRGNGRHAGLQRIVVRYALLPIDLVVVGELLALVTRRHQRLGDFAAGTVVARHRIRGFATALALVLIPGFVYAQMTLGGGLNTALAVTTEAAYFGPAYVGTLLSDIGIGSRPDAPSAR